MIDWEKNMRKLYKHTIEQFPCNSFICVKKNLTSRKAFEWFYCLLFYGSKV